MGATPRLVGVALTDRVGRRERAVLPRHPSAEGPRWNARIQKSRAAHSAHERFRSDFFFFERPTAITMLRKKPETDYSNNNNNKLQKKQTKKKEKIMNGKKNKRNSHFKSTEAEVPL